MDVAQGYGLWWENVSGVFSLILMEVCDYYVSKMLVLFSGVILLEK